MELRLIVVLSFLSCMTCAGTQRTFKRTCDCEYMVDGKCAYTLLLPPSDTCSQQGGGGNNAMPNVELLEQIERLKENITDVKFNSGEQAQMLSRLQSLLMTQQTSLASLSQAVNAITSAPTPPQNQCQLCPELETTLNSQKEAINSVVMEVDTIRSSIQSMSEAFGNLTLHSSVTYQEVLTAIQMSNLQFEALQKLIMELANNTMASAGMTDNKNNSMVMEVMKMFEMMNKTLVMQMMKISNTSRMMSGGVEMQVNSSMTMLMKTMEGMHMLNESLKMKMMEVMEMFDMMNKTIMMKARDDGMKDRNNTTRKECKCERRAFDCDMRGLLVSGPHANISDSMISASSMFNEFHAATRGRIFSKLENGFNGAWCAREVDRSAGEEEPNDPEEWLQFDLGKERSLFGVVTRGRSDYDQWVTSYKVKYTNSDPSLDTTTWTALTDIIGEPETLSGNIDRNTAKTNIFWQPIRARYVRVIPTASSDANKCMRADVIGCLDDQ